MQSMGRTQEFVEVGGGGDFYCFQVEEGFY